ncbi:hypothetical protein TSOC_014534, partial [Tetrabaena socialis]
MLDSFTILRVSATVLVDRRFFLSRRAFNFLASIEAAGGVPGRVVLFLADSATGEPLCTCWNLRGNVARRSLCLVPVDGASKGSTLERAGWRPGMTVRLHVMLAVPGALQATLSMPRAVTGAEQPLTAAAGVLLAAGAAFAAAQEQQRQAQLQLRQWQQWLQQQHLQLLQEQQQFQQHQQEQLQHLRHCAEAGLAALLQRQAPSQPATTTSVPTTTRATRAASDGAMGPAAQPQGQHGASPSPTTTFPPAAAKAPAAPMASLRLSLRHPSPLHSTRSLSASPSAAAASAATSLQQPAPLQQPTPPPTLPMRSAVAGAATAPPFAAAPAAYRSHTTTRPVTRSQKRPAPPPAAAQHVAAPAAAASSPAAVHQRQSAPTRAPPLQQHPRSPSTPVVPTASTADDAIPPHVLKAVGLTYNYRAPSTIHREGANAESAVCMRIRSVAEATALLQPHGIQHHPTTLVYTAPVRGLGAARPQPLNMQVCTTGHPTIVLGVDPVDAPSSSCILAAHTIMRLEARARIKVLFAELRALNVFSGVDRVSGEGGEGQLMSGKAFIPHDRLAIIPPCYAGVAKLAPATRSEIEQKWAELSELVAAEVDHFAPSAGRAMRVFVLEGAQAYTMGESPYNLMSWMENYSSQAHRDKHDAPLTCLFWIGKGLRRYDGGAFVWLSLGIRFIPDDGFLCVMNASAVEHRTETCVPVVPVAPPPAAEPRAEAYAPAEPPAAAARWCAVFFTRPHDLVLSTRLHKGSLTHPAQWAALQEVVEAVRCAGPTVNTKALRRQASALKQALMSNVVDDAVVGKLGAHGCT